MMVYFSKKYEDIVNEIDYSKLKGKVGIKVHFGERGNKTFLDPELTKKIYDEVVMRGHDCSLIECNVLYRGSRTNKEDHIKLAKEHGFDFAPIDILDGDVGEEKIELDVKKGIVDKARVGKGIERYDSLIVLSHFKGHVAAGFGGALKNLGMGLGSRSGKLHMHSDVSPSVLKRNCVGCRECLKGCDFDAISMIDGKAEINSEKCIGCAMCIAKCEYGAVKIPWGGSSNKELQEKIVDYSHAIIDYMDENILYINALVNITKDCDCMGKSMNPIMEDVGYLYGDDPVAIEKASLDLINEKSNEFDEINSVDNYHMVNYAKNKNLGKLEYDLIN
ncbi:MAG: DUF362 domain-containing protein [Candidatus Woesearchaeota archaeon]